MNSLSLSLEKELLSQGQFALSMQGAKEALFAMFVARFMDIKMSSLVKQNKGTGFFLSIAGHEMAGVVAAKTLRPRKDWALPYFRDRAFAVGLGADISELIAAFLARKTAHHSGGRMMLDHFSHKELRMPCRSSCVGAQFLQAVGVAQSVRLSGQDEAVYVSGGEGSTSQGDFHEALNYAALHKLPLIFMIQDNGWAISVPVSEQTAGGSIAPIARGFPGMAVFEVDGCDYGQMVKAMQDAVLRARKKEGPSVIVAKVCRLGPHSNSDDPTKYKDAELIEKERCRDPVKLMEAWLKERDFITDDQLSLLQTEAQEKVQAAALLAESIPFPPKEEAVDKVFVDFALPAQTLAACGAEINIAEAINHALIEEMQRDHAVLVFGEDVGSGKGGVFGITKGLSSQFGRERCFNTPLAESTIIGLAIGLSTAGNYKPVAEIQFADYLWTGANQLLNELPSIHYRSYGEWHCPTVIRMPYGGYVQGGPYHSQSVESVLVHAHGLKIAVPSNAADAKRLLKTAILDPNPVIFLEHKALYRRGGFCARPEPGKDELLEFGKAKLVREGSNATVVAYGMMVVFAEEVIAKCGFSVDLIDLRTLVPLDLPMIINSIKKTGKLLIVHEDGKTGGFGAEICALVVEKAFQYLDAPIQRVCAKDCITPFCLEQETMVLPQKEDIQKAIEELLSY